MASVRLIKTTELTSPQKQKLWAGIKQKQPELAELLQSEQVKQIMQEFDGCPVFTRDEIVEFMK